MIIKIEQPRFRQKIAFFDYDWTLVKPKGNRTFPKDVNDWEWLYPTVQDKLQQVYKRGYAIFIITNQTKAWKTDQIKEAMASVGVPLTLCIAYKEDERKPSISLIEQALGSKKEMIKKELSFMCGDALGRVNDHSDCDRGFAENMGIKVISPEEYFGTPKQESKVQLPKLKPRKNRKEVIVMVGMPGSGKTTIAETVFGAAGYTVVKGDDFKTSVKMIKEAQKRYDTEKKSIVFDATNPSKKKRAEYLAFANRNGLKARCVYVNVPFDVAFARNNLREKPVPRIAYNLYKKNFEEPNQDEGFEKIL